MTTKTVRAIIGLRSSEAASGITLSALRVVLLSMSLPQEVVIDVPAGQISLDASGNAQVVAEFRDIPPGKFSVVATSLDQDGNAIPGFSMSANSEVPQPNMVLAPASITVTLQ